MGYTGRTSSSPPADMSAAETLGAGAADTLELAGRAACFSASQRPQALDIESANSKNARRFMNSNLRPGMSKRPMHDSMADMVSCGQGFFAMRRAYATRFMLCVSLVLPGCRKSEQKTAPVPAASASAAMQALAAAEAAEAAEASTSKTMRALALQKPVGNTPIDKEIELLEKQLETKPDSTDTWILLGRMWARKARRTKDPGYWLNTNACAQITLGREPKHRLARELSAMVLLEQHAFAEAKDLADQLLVEDKDNLSALGTKSDAALELGFFDEALEAAQRMVDLKPNLPSYSRAAHLRWLQGDSEAAKKIYRAAFDARDPRDPEPYAWVLTEIATIFWHEGDIDGADKGFDLALAAFPDEPYALVGKARIALAKGDAKRAAELAERAYKQSPISEAAWVLGDARAAAGNVSGSEEAYGWVTDRHGKTDPRTAALFLAVKNRATNIGLVLARGEAKKRNDIHTRDVLAWTLYRQGDFSGARREIDAALEHGTREPMLLYHAGAIRIAQGEKAEGERFVRDALKLNPHFDSTSVNEAKILLGGVK